MTWNLLSEGLPTVGADVTIVCARDGDDGMESQFFRRADDGGFYMDAYGPYEEIADFTHWLVLPDPFKISD